MIILTWKHVPGGSLVGFCDVRLASGMVLHEVSIIRGKEGGTWASPPSKPMLGRDGRVMLDDAGKRRYTPIVSFVDAATRKRFSEGVIEALRLAHPEALAIEPVPVPEPEPEPEPVETDADWPF